MYIYTTCGHKRSSVDDSQCVFCLTNYKSTKECLQCSICMVWFHNDLPHVISNQMISRFYIFHLIKVSLPFSEELICDFQ